MAGTANGLSGQILRENHNRLISTSTTEESGSSPQLSIPPEHHPEPSTEAGNVLKEQTFDFSELAWLHGLKRKDLAGSIDMAFLEQHFNENVKAVLSDLDFNIPISKATGPFQCLVAGLECDLASRLHHSWSLHVLGGIDLDAFAKSFSDLMLASLTPVKRTDKRKSEGSSTGVGAAQNHLSELFRNWIASFDHDVLRDLPTNIGPVHARTAKAALLNDHGKMKTALINHLVPLLVQVLMSVITFGTIGVNHFPDEKNVFRSLVLDPLPEKKVMKDGLVFLTSEEFKLLSHRLERSVVTTCVCCGKLIGTSQPFNYCHHLGTCALVECDSSAKCYNLHWIIAVLGLECFKRNKPTAPTYVHPADVEFIKGTLSSIDMSLVGLLSVFCKQLPLGIQHNALGSKWADKDFSWTVPTQASRQVLQSKWEQLNEVACYYQRISKRSCGSKPWKVSVDGQERAYAFVHNNSELSDK